MLNYVRACRHAIGQQLVSKTPYHERKKAARVPGSPDKTTCWLDYGAKTYLRRRLADLHFQPLRFLGSSPGAFKRIMAISWASGALLDPHLRCAAGACTAAGCKLTQLFES
jgi:hypothetical protein